MELLIIASGVVAFVGAFFFTGKAIFHLYHVLTNVTGKYSGFFGPLLLLMPSQFNDKGNKHRVALGPTLFALMVCWFVLYFTGVVGK